LGLNDNEMKKAALDELNPNEENFETLIKRN
jgi:hypothetical protein